MVCEPSVMIFLTALKEIDLSKEIQDRPIAFIVEGLNGTEFIPVMQALLTLETLEFFVEEVHPNYKIAFPEQLREQIKQLTRYSDGFFVSFHTRRLLQEHAAQNVLYNLPHVAEGYHTMQLSKVIPYKGAAVLVSAGPSLNKNIEELRRAKNHLFLIAVDTAVKTTKKNRCRLQNLQLPPWAILYHFENIILEATDIRQKRIFSSLFVCLAIHTLLPCWTLQANTAHLPTNPAVFGHPM